MDILLDTRNADRTAQLIREHTNQLLVERLRAAFWVILFALGLYALRDVRLMWSELPSLYLIKLIEIAALIAVRVALRNRKNWSRAVPISVLTVSSIYVMTAASAILRHDVLSTPLAFTALAVASAALLPWGPGAQLVSVAVAALATMWNLHSVTGNGAAALGYPTVAMTVASVASLYVAYELRRQRVTIEERTIALGRSEEHFRSLVESSLDLITFINLDGTVGYEGPAVKRVLGYEPGEFIGRSVFDLIHPDDRVRVIEAFGRRIRGGESSPAFEFRIRHTDGSWRIVETRAATLRDASGTVTGLVANARDVTERKQLEKRLRRSEQHFRSLIENASDIISVVDWDGTIRYDSPSLARVMGYAADELIGTNVFERIHPDDAAEALAGFTRRINQVGDTQPLVIRVQHKNGTWLVMETLATRLPEGSSVGPVVINTRDITERTHAETALRESEERYRELLENATDVVYTHDLEGRFTSVNRAATALIGHTREEALQRSIVDLVAPEHLERAIQATARQLAGETVPAYELDILTQDGRRTTVEVHTRLLSKDGVPIGVQGIARDITERKRAEAELQRAKEAAEAANRAKSEFVANMSHEIRTPMNGIIGMTELALQTQLTAEQREYLQMVASSGAALLTVINDVLDFSKMEAGKIDLDNAPFDLRDAIGDTVRVLAPRAHLKDLELAYEIDPAVPEAIVADVYRLRQILTNLAGNSIKFTDRGEVLVSVTLDESAGADICLHFAIRDTGVGIPAEKQQTIFRAFEQADGSTTRKYGGTGLGLTISRYLVEVMGGRVWVESEVGCGSTFHFTIRCAASAQPLARQPVASADLRDLLVLVVDDNATNRRILNEILTHWQMRPTTVDGGVAALGCMMRAVAAGRPFPLVLIDVHMPEMDGFELAERIKQTPALASATVMMLSSADLTGEARRCRELGVAGFLTKPLRQSELLDAMLVALGNVAPTGPPATERQNAANIAALQLRILLAEDNAVNQRLAVRLLEKRSHKVTVADNGREALAALAQQVFDLVLMDVQMPEMDGFEATAAIRALEGHSGAHVPIIAMTAHAMTGDRERCLAAGMDGYITKPINAQDLLGTIESLIAAGSEASRDVEHVERPTTPPPPEKAENRSAP